MENRYALTISKLLDQGHDLVDILEAIAGFEKSNLRQDIFNLFTEFDFIGGE